MLGCHPSLTPAEWSLPWKGQSEPVRMVSFRAFSGRQNQSSPHSAVVFMAQPRGPSVHSLVFLPVWKLCSQVPQEPWALPCVFWDRGHICTRNLLSQLSSQTVYDVEKQTLFIAAVVDSTNYNTPWECPSFISWKSSLSTSFLTLLNEITWTYFFPPP